MKKNLIILIALLFVTLSGWATQGPGITASTVAVVSGATTAVVPIKVEDANFVDVGSFCLTFAFDYANLGIPTVTYTNPAFASAGWDALVYTTEPAIYETGKFRVSGFGEEPANKVTLNSGDIMFTITFTKAGGITSCGIVDFDDTPTAYCEFAGPAIPGGGYIPYDDGTYTNGKVQLNKVYVDPAYTPGNGCDQFPTIQAAVNFLELSNDGGTVSVNTNGHTYTEDVTVTKNGITFDNTDAGTIVIDGDLTIPAAATTLTLAGDLTVTGVLTLTDADDYLIIGANTLNLNGTIAGAGSLTSTDASTLSIGGSGSAFGTIHLNGNLNVLTVNRAAQTISLGTCTSFPLEINTLNLTAGELALGDNALQINTTYTPGTGTFSAGETTLASLDFMGATSGAIKFSGASLVLPGLHIHSSGSIDIATAMEIQSVDVFTGTLTNSEAVTFDFLTNDAIVTMNADIMITTSFNSSDDAAVVNVNDHKLTLNCTISPTDDTYIIAGGTSSLAFGGDYIPVPPDDEDPPVYRPAYTLPANIASLYNLEINRFNGVTMGADLDVLGTLTLTSGAFTMNGKTLTINNPMVPYPLTGVLGDDPTATLIVNGTVSTPLPEMNLYKLRVNIANANPDIGVVLEGVVSIYNYLDLKDGAVDNTDHDILIESGATIERSGGSLSAEPVDLDHLHVLYTNTSSITEGFEIPSENFNTHVEMNGAGGVVWNEDHIIDDLTLTAGNITLGAFDFTTTITADGSATSYVIADGTGTFTVVGVTAADVFPVGYASGYTPLSISNSVASDFAVNLKNAPTLADFTAPVPSPNFVEMQWNITRSAGGTATVTFNWNPAEDFATVPTVPVLGRYNGTDWVSAGSATFGSQTVTVTGITAFSPFAAYGDLLTTVYVDDAIGDPTHTGENVANSPDGTGPKKTIQQGLTVVANPGTIYVAAGTYPENIIVNKDVTIEGAGATTIVNGNDNTAYGSVFYVETNGVTLKKMKIVNTVGDPISTLFAIWVVAGLNDILIQENTITNNAGTGIYFAGSVGTTNVVYKNIFDGTSSGDALNTDGTAIVTGTGNYWGSDNGPYIDPGAGGVNPCGVDGKHISAYITYNPWMNAALTSDIYQGKRVISGTFTYPNSAGDITMKTGISLTLKRTDNNAVMATATTTTSGDYAFDGQCTNCNYYIVATSLKTTDGAVNTTDAGQANYWSAHPYTIDLVRFFAGDVTENNYIQSTDALLIQQNFVNGTPFPRESWSFFDKTTTISLNPDPPSNPYPASYRSVDLQREVDYTVDHAFDQDMHCLATGDFNRSFNPDLTKAASATLDLIYAGNRQISSNQEFELPVQMVNASGVGAVSLILNFPVEFVEVLDVTMNGAGGQLDWAAKGNELRIGWNSSSPLYLSAGAELVTLKLRTTAAFTIGNPIRISLAADPLNELADAMYEVIGNAVLSVDVIEASATGTPEMPAAPYALSFSTYPNPFRNFTTITYTLPFDGKVVLEISSIMGSKVTTLVSETQPSGNHEVRFNTTGLPPGVYMATLRLKSANDELIRSIKLVYNK